MDVFKADWVSHGGMAINSVDIQPGGMRFVTGGGDGKVKIWLCAPLTSPALEGIAALRAPLAIGTHHSGSVNVVRWSYQGDLLASAGDDHCILLWRQRAGSTTQPSFGATTAEQTEDWYPCCILKGHTLEIQDVSWSLGDRFLASASFDTTVRVWQYGSASDAGRRHELGAPSTPAKRMRRDSTGATEPAHASNQSAKQSSDNDIMVGSCVAELRHHVSWSQGVAWDPFQQVLVSCGDDKQVVVWAEGTSSSTGSHAFATDASAQVAGSKRSRAGMSSTRDSHDTLSFSMLKVIHEPYLECPGESATRRVSFSPDGLCVATPNGLESAVTPEGRPADPIFTTPLVSRIGWKVGTFLTGHTRPTVATRFAPGLLSCRGVTYPALAVGSKDGSISIWQPPEMSVKPVCVLSVGSTPISDFAWGGCCPTPYLSLGASDSLTKGISTTRSTSQCGAAPYLLATTLDGTLLVVDMAPTPTLTPATSSTTRATADFDASNEPTLGRYADMDACLRHLATAYGIPLTDIADEVAAQLQECRRATRDSATEAKAMLHRSVLSALDNAVGAGLHKLASGRVSKDALRRVAQNVGLSARQLRTHRRKQRHEDDESQDGDSSADEEDKGHAHSQQLSALKGRVAAAVGAPEIARWCIEMLPLWGFPKAVMGVDASTFGSTVTSLLATISIPKLLRTTAESLAAGESLVVAASSNSSSNKGVSVKPLLPPAKLPTLAELQAQAQSSASHSMPGDADEVLAAQTEQRLKGGRRRIAPVQASFLSPPRSALESPNAHTHDGSHEDGGGVLSAVTRAAGAGAGFVTLQTSTTTIASVTAASQQPPPPLDIPLLDFGLPAGQLSALDLILQSLRPGDTSDAARAPAGATSAIVTDGISGGVAPAAPALAPPPAAARLFRPDDALLVDQRHLLPLVSPRKSASGAATGSSASSGSSSSVSWLSAGELAMLHTLTEVDTRKVLLHQLRSHMQPASSLGAVHAYGGGGSGLGDRHMVAAFAEFTRTLATLTSSLADITAAARNNAAQPGAVSAVTASSGGGVGVRTGGQPPSVGVPWLSAIPKLPRVTVAAAPPGGGYVAVSATASLVLDPYDLTVADMDAFITAAPTATHADTSRGSSAGGSEGGYSVGGRGDNVPWTVRRVVGGEAEWSHTCHAAVGVMTVHALTGTRNCVLIGCADGTLYILDAQSGVSLAHPIVVSPAPVRLLYIRRMAASTLLQALCNDGQLRLWQLQSAEHSSGSGSSVTFRAVLEVSITPLYAVMCGGALPVDCTTTVVLERVFLSPTGLPEVTFVRQTSNESCSTATAGAGSNTGSSASGRVRRTFQYSDTARGWLEMMVHK